MSRPALAIAIALGACAAAGAMDSVGLDRLARQLEIHARPAADAGANDDGGPAAPNDEGPASEAAGSEFGVRWPSLGTNLTYHGGPVMTGEKHFYYIWYGDWSAKPDTVDILTDFASSLGGSPYFATNTVYKDRNGNPISPDARYAGSFEDRYSQGADLRGAPWKSLLSWFIPPYLDDTMSRIVKNAIDNGLPADPDGIYIIVPSRDVTHPVYYGVKLCGYHWHASIDGVDVKYAFIGNPNNALPIFCHGTGISPNGDPAADAMVNIIAHEINEAVTDPDGDGWYQGKGEENGDLCQTHFGEEGLTPEGASYNVALGSRKYRIQENFVNDDEGGHCRLSPLAAPSAEPGEPVEVAEAFGQGLPFELSSP